MAILDFSEHPVTLADDTKKTVPTDVFAYIIAFLDAFWDFHAIVNCTLVCRAWFACGRAKLFHSIRFETQQCWIMFKPFLTPAAPPHITQYFNTVREVAIDLDNGQEERGSWAHEILVECSQHLTGLKLLSLYAIPWTPEWSSSLLSIPHHSYDSIEEIRMHNMSVLDFLDLYRLFSNFPHVSRVKMLDLSFQYWLKRMPTTRLQELEQLPKLQSLTELRLGPHHLEVTHWIPKSGLIERLSHFSFNYDCINSKKRWTKVSKMIDSHTLTSLGCEVDLGECRKPCAYFDRIFERNGTDSGININMTC